MLAYIVRRLLWSVLLLLVISFLVFLIFYLLPSADPVLLRAGRNPDPALVAALNRELGLDDPWYVQFWKYISKLVTDFDFGFSYQNNIPVREEIFSRMPATISLAIGAAVVWLLVGIPIGIFAALTLTILLDGQWGLRESDVLLFGLVGGVAGAIGIRVVRRRHHLYLAIGIIAVGGILASIAVGLTRGWSGFTITASAFLGLLMAPASASLAMIVMPLAESATRITTDCASRSPANGIGPVSTVPSPAPARTWLAARFTASSPLAQKRLIASPGTFSPMPLASTADRARQPPCSPIWVTLPQITSSTAFSGNPLRALSVSSVSADSRSDVTSCRLPSGRPLPRGVRTAS